MDETMTTKQRNISRRTLLKGAAATAAVPVLASCVGAQTAAPTATATTGTGASSAPSATPKLGGTLSILQWSHFVPAFDTYLDSWAKTWGAKYGVDV